MRFNPSHKYLLCFDSDGTVMDTMTIKHERCFGPKFLEVYGISHDGEDILNHWLNVNLYEKTRGINRFQGLSEILHYSKKFGYTFPGEEAFHQWVLNTSKFSEALLEKEIEKDPENDTLKKALLWSKEVNKAIVALPPSLPFEGVCDILPRLPKDVDLLGVSSANKAAVDEEWNRLGLAKHFKEVACQDVGSKTQIIAEGLACGYEKANVVMVGDAIGDLVAAENNGVNFYPIIPGHEAESWAALEERCLKPLLEGRFDKAYHEQLKEEFMKALS